MADTSSSAGRLQAIRWESRQLVILNQLLLPHSSEYVKIADCHAGHHAIASMQTRGAPAIAIVAALSLAAELNTHPEFDSSEAACNFIHERLDFLATSRPTAVNLFAAVRELKQVADQALHENTDVREAYIQAAEQMLAADIADNQAIGRFGADFLTNEHKGQLKVLTHCNTGALATAGYGTALGIVRRLWEQGKLEQVVFTETRPYNQGARLTSYELLAEQIPSRLICDSAVSALLKSDPQVSAIIVGADRVAANGDTANKIGTYQLAISARFHNRKFIVAAPSTSIDLNIGSGREIVIEERDDKEITRITGVTCDSLQGGKVEMESVQIAPLETRAWNPSFDVTPADLISAIVTERGVFVKQPGADVFDLASDLM
ncbi:S-methyl-5-thioribose-1-phosphate isomerase [Coemansia brasiliensis]|uniref:Methylthioribose-1-phosphate isomerase n=1 Tax=Coemansia brasiliensis TaxID=2650707 RepID=A0A9W8I8H5_9FUNG|nr:S-methyl-5-thioribose-1-phosphate isomerase [Coemansia brasiliensis]